MSYDSPECTMFVANLEPRVTEEHLWELFLQAGPLHSVKIPMDRNSGKSRSFAFVTFRDECSLPYACELFNSIRLFKKSISCRPTRDDSKKNSEGSPGPPRSPNDSFSTPQPPPLLPPPPTNSGGYSSSSEDSRRRSHQGNDRGFFESPGGGRDNDRRRMDGERSHHDDRRRSDDSWSDRDRQRQSPRHEAPSDYRLDSSRHSNHSNSPAGSHSGEPASPMFMHAVNQMQQQMHQRGGGGSPMQGGSGGRQHNGDEPSHGPMRHEQMHRENRDDRRKHFRPY